MLTRASQGRLRPRSSPKLTPPQPTLPKLPRSRLRHGKLRHLRLLPSPLCLPRRLLPLPLLPPLLLPPPPLCRRRAPLCLHALQASIPQLARALVCRRRSSQVRLQARGLCMLRAF